MNYCNGATPAHTFGNRYGRLERGEFFNWKPTLQDNIPVVAASNDSVRRPRHVVLVANGSIGGNPESKQVATIYDHEDCMVMILAKPGPISAVAWVRRSEAELAPRRGGWHGQREALVRVRLTPNIALINLNIITRHTRVKLGARPTPIRRKLDQPVTNRDGWH
ncbi:MAG: hypothetical protein U0R49_00165 [Fimbriimonadales bacterium]